MDFNGPLVGKFTCILKKYIENNVLQQFFSINDLSIIVDKLVWIALSSNVFLSLLRWDKIRRNSAEVQTNPHLRP